MVAWILLSLFLPSTEAADDLGTLIKRINWSELNLPFVAKVPSGKKYYRLTFEDDFKGKPDQSTRSNYCYDVAKPQCSTWWQSGETTKDCLDTSHTPPIRANLKSALYSLNPGSNYEGLSLTSIQQLYGQTLQDNWKHLNKCNWVSYSGVNWMATDYGNPPQYSSKMDASQVTVDPQGKGYLILSARKGKVVEDCAFGGTHHLLPSRVRTGSAESACLIKPVPGLAGPLGIYWVDSDKKWPGIYYAKINGQCSYGGQTTAESPNCQVLTFNPGELSPMIRYGLVAVNGSAQLFYSNHQKFACQDHIEYPTSGVAFNQLSCPVLNGGISSKHFFNSSDPTDMAGKNGFSQQNGVFEVKLRIPKGPGAFPAAWLIPTRGGWPYSGGEIDIMEARDDANEVHQTYHHGKCIDFVNQTEILQDPENPLARVESGNCSKAQNASSVQYSRGITTRQVIENEFNSRDHVFTAEWDQTGIRYYVNNRLMDSIQTGSTPEKYTHLGGYLNSLSTSPTNLPDAIPSNLRQFTAINMPRDPFYWILNHSTYVTQTDLGNWQSQHFLIDYVKTYSLCQTQKDFCPNGGIFQEGVGCVVTNRDGLQTIQASACVESFNSRLCPNGGKQAGPNCWVHGFSKPKMIPGVNYWVDHHPAYAGIYYAKVNGECPFGGSKGVNCMIDSISPGIGPNENSKVLPGIQYWVDTNPSWPGVFYRKINNACPLGGSGPANSPNCQLRSYPSGALRTTVSYWVDTDPRWPGVYYQKTKQGCPYGGTSSGTSPNCQLTPMSVPSLYLNPNVQYWVDTDLRWPGLYYAKINGSCPYGGSVGVNCQLKSFPLTEGPYVMPNVNYWVDTNPSWPGIYYAKINGACPYGGTAGVNCQLLAFPAGVVEPGVNYWVDKDPRWPGVYYLPDFR